MKQTDTSGNGLGRKLREPNLVVIIHVLEILGTLPTTLPTIRIGFYS
jgi:hypothetical protein